jgi:hypothetical protein
MNRMHFSIEPVSKLGNWIPAVLQQWQCVDHLCGLDQVVIQMEGIFCCINSSQLKKKIKQ